MQTGPPHIGLAHLGLVKQLPEALQGGKGAQLLQQLLRIQVGPLDVRAAPEEGISGLVKTRGQFPPSTLLPRDPGVGGPSFFLAALFPRPIEG